MGNRYNTMPCVWVPPKMNSCPILSLIVESSPLASRVVLEGGCMPSGLLSSFCHTWLFFHGMIPPGCCHSQLTSKPFSGYEYGSAPLPHLFGATGSKTVTEFSSFVTCKTISSLSTPYHLGYKHICGVSCPSTIGSRHKSLSFCFLKAHLVFHPQPQVFLF